MLPPLAAGMHRTLQSTVDTADRTSLWLTQANKVEKSSSGVTVLLSCDIFRPITGSSQRGLQDALWCLVDSSNIEIMLGPYTDTHTHTPTNSLMAEQWPHAAWAMGMEWMHSCPSLCTKYCELAVHYKRTPCLSTGLTHILTQIKIQHFKVLYALELAVHVCINKAFWTIYFFAESFQNWNAKMKCTVSGPSWEDDWVSKQCPFQILTGEYKQHICFF